MSSKPPTLQSPLMDSELEQNLVLARPRSGNSADLASRDRAIAYLLAHETEAYPRLLSDLRRGVDVEVTLSIIALFRRGETIAVLVELMSHASGDLKRHVAVALGQHPQPEAQAILLESLGSSDRETTMAAIAGLGVTHSPDAAPALRPLLTSPDAEVRWLTVNSLSNLSALDAAELSQIVSHDPDVYVRELAEEKLKTLSKD